MNRLNRLAAPLAALILLFAVAACGGDTPPPEVVDGAEEAMTPSEPVQPEDLEESPQDAFLANLSALCGRAFRGEAELATSDDFDDEMIMHVRVCEEDEVQIPLHVGEDRSRTWIITRTAEGLRLKHDHRHEDGSEDIGNTQYGGDTEVEGTPLHQSFPADEFTAEMIPEAETNVWNITLEPGERLIYHLTRHGAPRATFVFDLTDEVDPPPAPWGYEGT